jgi:hypothetical protein
MFVSTKAQSPGELGFGNGRSPSLLNRALRELIQATALFCEPTTVDDERGAGDKAGGIAGEKKHRLGDLIDLAHAVHRVLAGHILHGLLTAAAGETRDHVGFNRGRRYRIHADARSGKFQSRSLGEAFDGVLGGDVDAGACHPDVPGDAAGVDDRAAAAR